MRLNAVFEHVAPVYAQMMGYDSCGNETIQPLGQKRINSMSRYYVFQNDATIDKYCSAIENINLLSAVYPWIDRGMSIRMRSKTGAKT